MLTPKKLRISYTLLSLWARGKTDEAITAYFHIIKPTSPQVKEGKDKHEEIAKIVRDTGQFPSWLSSIKLHKPLPEHEIIVPYNNFFDIKAIVDCLDSPSLFEYKTGISDSLKWANKLQVPFYFLVCELAHIPVDKAYLLHFNQYTQNSDWTLIWNNKKAREKAKNLIDTIAPEIYDFLLEQNLL